MGASTVIQTHKYTLPVARQHNEESDVNGKKTMSMRARSRDMYTRAQDKDKISKKKCGTKCGITSKRKEKTTSRQCSP